jgi:hypothetical protein
MLILSILHNIFLSTEQTKQLHSGEDVEVIGASLPVWYYKGNTSEPAEEVFCKYLLTNKKTENQFAISLAESNDGYVINMPQLPEDYVPRVALEDSLWRAMTEDEQLDWYADNPVPDSSKNLLPINEGGGEYLHFKENGKTLVNNRNVATLHVVEIKTLGLLFDSFD